MVSTANLRGMLAPGEPPPSAAVASASGTCLWDAGWALAGLVSMGIAAGPSLTGFSLDFLDSGQYLSSGEGMFRRPSEGQSLISYLSEQDFGSCADLEKVRDAAAAFVHWTKYLTAGSMVLPSVGRYPIAVHRTLRLSSSVVSGSQHLPIWHVHSSFATC